MGKPKFKIKTKTETEAGVEVRGEFVLDETNKSLFVNNIGHGQLFLSNLKPEAAEAFSIGQVIELDEISL